MEKTWKLKQAVEAESFLFCVCVCFFLNIYLTTVYFEYLVILSNCMHIFVSFQLLTWRLPSRIDD